MRKVGIELVIDNNTICILAGEMDSEDLWEEIGDAEFVSNVLNGLTVEIFDKEYIYTLKDCSNLQVSIVNLYTGERLCDYITIEELLKTPNICDDINIKHLTFDSTLVTVLGENIMFKETKLVSFKNRKSIMQIIM